MEDLTKMHLPPRQLQPAGAPPAPLDPAAALRSALVGRAERPRRTEALSRPLGPGLYEVVYADRGPSRPPHRPSPADLAALGLAPRTIFRAARNHTCAAPFEVVRHELHPGARIWRIRGPRHATGIVALELERLLAEDGPADGWLLAAPNHGVAAVVPLGPAPDPQLAEIGALVPPPADEICPPAFDVLQSAHALAAFAQLAHDHLPRPISCEIYWARTRRLVPVCLTGRGRERRIVPDHELSAAIARAQAKAPAVRRPPPRMRPPFSPTPPGGM